MKKLPAFFEARKFVCVFTRARHLARSFPSTPSESVKFYKFSIAVRNIALWLPVLLTVTTGLLQLFDLTNTARRGDRIEAQASYNVDLNSGSRQLALGGI